MDTPPHAAGELAERNRNGAAAVELADAERADVLHHATPEQVQRLARVRTHRSHDDRRRAWRDVGASAAPGQTRLTGWPPATEAADAARIVEHRENDVWPRAAALSR